MIRWLLSKRSSQLTIAIGVLHALLGAHAETVSSEFEIYFDRAPQQTKAGMVPGFVGNIGTPKDVLFPGLKQIPADVLEELEDSLGFELAKRPRTASSVFWNSGLHFPLLESVPLDILEPDIRGANDVDDELSTDEATTAIFSILNIRLVAPHHRIYFPPRADLHFRFTQNSDSILVSTPVREVKPGQYQIENVAAFAKSAERKLEEFASSEQRPELEISHISGIPLDGSTVESLPKYLGTLLYHSVYLGSIHLVTGYQWAGRLEGLPMSQQPMFVQ